MWWTMIWQMIWPSLASIAVAALAWLAMRKRAGHGPVGRRRTVAAVGAAVVFMMGFPVIALLPLWTEVSIPTWSAVFDRRFALPLVLGLLVVAVLGLPRRRPDAPAGAHLAPRTWRSFLATWWLGACLAVLAVVVGLTLAAGFASAPDDQNRYTMYIVDFGSSAAGSTIYGWHYSVLPLALLALMVVITWWSLATIARPPLGDDHVVDAAVRRRRSTDVIRVVLGALLLHLQMVLESLAATSSLTSTRGASDGSYFIGGTPFSAFTGALQVSGTLVGIVGLALWIYTALTAFPRMARSSAASVSP